MKRMISNILLVIFPICIALVFILFLLSDSDIMRGASLFQFHLPYYMYIVLLFVFSYFFIIKEVKYNVVFLWIGFIISIGLTFGEYTEYVSFPLSRFIVGDIGKWNLGVVTPVFGSISVIYAILLVTYYKKS